MHCVCGVASADLNAACPFSCFYQYHVVDVAHIPVLHVLLSDSTSFTVISISDVLTRSMLKRRPEQRDPQGCVLMLASAKKNVVFASTFPRPSVKAKTNFRLGNLVDNKTREDFGSMSFEQSQNISIWEELIKQHSDDTRIPNRLPSTSKC